MKINNVETPVKMNKKVTDLIVSGEVSKSQKMKDLFSLGYSVKQISVMLEVRYNFVYNVISNHVLINEIELEDVKKESKKEKIIELFNEGKSNKEIQIELKCNYNYVYNTLKKYKQESLAE